MQDNKDKNKNKVVSVRLGPKELEDLQEIAEALGVKPSEAIRHCVLLASGKRTLV